MKNIYYTLSIMCLLLVFGCKKDKEVVVPEDLRTQIAGKWIFENATFKSYINDKEDTSDGYTVSGAAGDYIEFTADGKISAFLNNKLKSDVYTLDEDNKTITFDG